MEVEGRGDHDDLHVAPVSEHLISEQLAPQYTTSPSIWSRGDLLYTGANGSTMPNMGEKQVEFRISDCRRCMLKMQVTDVRRPLISVARICGAGYQFVFASSGGCIQHLETGQATSLYRDCNIYIMDVETMKSRGGFQLAGEVRTLRVSFRVSSREKERSQEGGREGGLGGKDSEDYPRGGRWINTTQHTPPIQIVVPFARDRTR